MKIAFRMDDITADMNWENFLRMKALFDRCGIRPLLGVVPDNRDETLHCQEPRPDFWEYLRKLQEEGWLLAQHGCSHQYTTGSGGLFPLNRFSEFAGLPLEEQREKIGRGKRLLQEKGIETDIFMAPGHSYDKNTLRALRECGFRYVTDGFGRKPYCREGLIFLPIAEKRSACFTEREGYTTLVLHANGMNHREMEWYEGMPAVHGEKLLSYEKLLTLPVRRRGFAGNLSEYAKACAKRILVGLRGAGKTQEKKSAAGEPVRILQVLGGTGLGGAESRVMDLYRHLDRSRIRFDFCVHTSEPGFYDAEIERLGGHVYRVPRFRAVNWLAYRRAWKEFFRAHPDYAAVHGHMTSTASIYLPIARKSGVPLTIAHARSAGVDPGPKGWLTRFLRRNLWKKADLCLACSRLAGEAVFGKARSDGGHVRIVPNAIDAEAFVFCQEIRERKRRELGIGQEELVIGHVGRFGHMKNHGFLLEVFSCICRKAPASRLLLVGEGGLMEEMKEKAAALGVADRVIFAGSQARVAEYDMAMDFFVFPSIFEGLPGSVIEAQATGLRCLVSDSVTPEVLITPLAEAMSLKEGPEAWAERVLEKRDYVRMRMTEAVREAGFDVSDQVKRLERMYLTGDLPETDSRKIRGAEEVG